MSLFEFLREGSDPSHRPGAGGTAEPEAGLVLMLAQQAIARWQFDLQRFDDAPAEDGALVAREAEMACGQIRALRGRVAPFLNFVDMATRFEAEEVDIALGALDDAFSRLAPDDANLPWQEASRVAGHLAARRH